MLFRSLHRVLILFGIALCLTVNASPQSGSAVTDILGQLPPCGLQCLIEAAPAIGCGALDIECQCASTNSTQIVQPCLEKSCTYEETFEILRAQATLCNRPHDSRGTSIKINAWITGMLPVVAITMRFASRYLGGKGYWWDDWLHLVSVILVIPMTAALLMCVESGIGHHIWDLSYAQVFAFGKWTYIATLFWAFELLILKFSILCLYLRIFPNLWLKRFIYAFMAFSILFTLPLIGLAAFQCLPIYAIWDLEARKTARCIDWITVLRLTVVYEIIAETVLFGLPVPIVWRLQMERSKKVQLMVFFGLGVCVIAVSIARLPFLPGVVNTVDPTYTIVGTSITGFAASGVGHVCAAVPTVKTLLRFCRNGFSLNAQSKQSSGFVKDSGGAPGAAGSSGKRSYKSLQDEIKTGGSGYSGSTLKASQKSGKSGKSWGKKKKGDPFRLSTIAGLDGDGRFMELQPVSAAGRNEERDLERGEDGAGKDVWIVEERRGDGGADAIERVLSEPRTYDSASDKTILSKSRF